MSALNPKFKSILVAICLVLFFAWLWNFLQYWPDQLIFRDCKNWPFVIGEITDSYVEKRRCRRDSDYYWYARLSYRFTVNQKNFIGHQITMHENQFILPNQKAGRDFMRQFAVGKRVTVYFKRSDPAQCLLLPREYWYMPQEAVSYLRQGDAYSHKGQYQTAIEHYSQAIERNPTGFAFYSTPYPCSAESHLSRGLAYDKLHQHQKAVEDFNIAIEDFNETISRNPKDAWAYDNRGFAYAELGQYQKAIENYSQALTLNPKDSWAYYNRSIAYKNLGQSTLSAADKTKAAELGYKP